MFRTPELGKTYSLEDYPFEEILISLNRFIARCEEREGVTIDWADALQSKLSLLSGRYGIGILMATATCATSFAQTA